MPTIIGRRPGLYRPGAIGQATPGYASGGGPPIIGMPYAAWTFDSSGVSGLVVTDWTGNGHVGHLSAITPPTSVAGSLASRTALSFVTAGTQSFNTNSPIPFGTGDFTIACHVKATTVTQCIFFQARFNTPYNGVNMEIDNNLYVSLNGNPTGNPSNYVTTGLTLNDGVWHDIVIICTRASNAVAYIDGVLQSPALNISSVSTVNFNPPELTYIANQPRDYASYFYTQVSAETAVWLRALTSTEALKFHDLRVANKSLQTYLGM